MPCGPGPALGSRCTGAWSLHTPHTLQTLALKARTTCCRSAPDEAIDLDVDYESEVAPGLGRLLGRGGYGEVYEGRWRGQRVAVKLLSMDSEELRQVGGWGEGSEPAAADIIPTSWSSIAFHSKPPADRTAPYKLTALHHTS
jgi:hypothetical protein